MREDFARKLFAGPCDFKWGASRIDNLPPQGLREVAFVGRSNVGKSSLINALTGRKTVARVSQTPGRTREINFFNLGGHSLMGAQLIAKVQQRFAVELSLRSLFDHPTIAEISAEIERLLYSKLHMMTDEEAQRILESVPDGLHA